MNAAIRMIETAATAVTMATFESSLTSFKLPLEPDFCETFVVVLRTG